MVTVKDFVSPITTKPWGKYIPKLAEKEKPKQRSTGFTAALF